MTIPSLLPSGHTAESGYMDLPSTRALPLQTEDASVGDDLFGLNYGDPDTSFTSADVLSHFLGSGTDVIMGDSYDFEQLGDREALGWFGENLRDLGRPY